MKKPVLMPALSPTMESGKLVKWHVGVGDTVSSGDVIAEIETDKATMELEAFDDGKIDKILVEEGVEGVAVNSEIALMEIEGEAAVDPPQVSSDLAHNSASSASPNGSVARGDAISGSGAPHAKPPQASPPEASGSPLTKPSSQAQNDSSHFDPSAGSSSELRRKASPFARKIARDNGLDLSRLSGSGPHGRIVKGDVLDAIESGNNAHMAAGSHAVRARAIQEVPVSGMRKIIAERLVQSKNEIPHFYLNIECDVTCLMALRKRINTAKELKITVNDFIIKAVAMAMADVEEVNCSWNGNSIKYYNFVDISVAVALEDGLVTPIIFDADQKSLSQISAEAAEIIAKARARKLKPSDYEGGNFTISNLGMFGIKNFNAIINPPQACIIAVGGVRKAPEFDQASNSWQPVDQVSCTLSVDHRAVDGAAAAKFLARFKLYMQDPTLMLV